MTVLAQATQVATVLVSTLLAAVTDAHRAIATRPAAPILYGLRFRTVAGRLEITGFNYDVCITKRVDIAGALPDLLVSGIMLKTSLKNLNPKAEVALSVEDDQLVLVQGTRRVALGLKGLDLAEYPDTPKVPTGRNLTMTGEQVRFIGDKLTVFASRDDMLPVLTAVHLMTADGILMAGSTDRFRAALAELPVKVTEDMKVLVPGMSVIGQVFSPADEVAVTLNDESIHFSSADTTVSQRVLDGQFPRLTHLFPDRPEVTATFEPVAFLKALKFVETGVERNCAVHVTVDDGKISLSNPTSDNYATMSDHVPAEIGGQNAQLGIETGFNAQFLADVVKVWGKGHDVTMASTSGTKPSVFTSPAAPELRVLIMPRRLLS
jgi:DNA polymerase III subunit beta